MTLLGADSDRWHAVYFAMVLCGAGFLFPFNSFVAAGDYFAARYPATYEPMFYLPLCYMYVTAATTLGVVLFNAQRIAVRWRIRFGYAMFIGALGLVMAVESAHTWLGNSSAYTCILVAVAVTSLGSGVQQSSYYGLAGLLPSERYTSALMIGESVAGVVVALNRIITKSTFTSTESTELRAGFNAFFGISLGFMGLCVVMHEFVHRRPFVQLHIARARAAGQPDIALAELTDAVGDADDDNDDNDNGGGIGEDEDDVGGDDTASGALLAPAAPAKLRTEDRKEGVDMNATLGVMPLRLLILTLKQTLAAVFLSFFVTLSIFPGVLSSIKSKRWGDDWMQVILVFVFNLFDLIGKLLPLLFTVTPAHAPRLLVATVLRLVLIPSLILCATPDAQALLHGEGWSLVLTAVLGLSGGLTATLGMQLGPLLVSPAARERAGLVQTATLLAGLTCGATLSMLFSHWL